MNNVTLNDEGMLTSCKEVMDWLNPICPAGRSYALMTGSPDTNKFITRFESARKDPSSASKKWVTLSR